MTPSPCLTHKIEQRGMFGCLLLPSTRLLSSLPLLAACCHASLRSCVRLAYVTSSSTIHSSSFSFLFQYFTPLVTTSVFTPTLIFTFIFLFAASAFVCLWIPLPSFLLFHCARKVSFLFISFILFFSPFPSCCVSLRSCRNVSRIPFLSSISLCFFPFLCVVSLLYVPR